MSEAETFQLQDLYMPLGIYSSRLSQIVKRITECHYCITVVTDSDNS